jgi:hypothetical protein
MKPAAESMSERAIGRQSIYRGKIRWSWIYISSVIPGDSVFANEMMHNVPPFLITLLHSKRSFGIFGSENNSMVKLMKTASKN